MQCLVLEGFGNLNNYYMVNKIKDTLIFNLRCFGFHLRDFISLKFFFFKGKG